MGQLDDSKTTEATTGITAGDYIHYKDIQNWSLQFSADADRFGNIRNALYSTPDGVYVHVTYRPGEKTQLSHGTVTQTYAVKQVGTDIETNLLGADDDANEEANYLIYDWPVYDAHWSGRTVSISTNMDGYEHVGDVDDIRDAGKHNVTFEVALNGGDDE